MYKLKLIITISLQKKTCNQSLILLLLLLKTLFKWNILLYIYSLLIVPTTVNNSDFTLGYINKKLTEEMYVIIFFFNNVLY